MNITSSAGSPKLSTLSGIPPTSIKGKESCQIGTAFKQRVAKIIKNYQPRLMQMPIANIYSMGDERQIASFVNDIFNEMCKQSPDTDPSTAIQKMREFLAQEQIFFSVEEIVALVEEFNATQAIFIGSVKSLLSAARK